METDGGQGLEGCEIKRYLQVDTKNLMIDREIIGKVGLYRPWIVGRLAQSAMCGECEPKVWINELEINLNIFSRVCLCVRSYFMLCLYSIELVQSNIHFLSPCGGGEGGRNQWSNG